MAGKRPPEILPERWRFTASERFVPSARGSTQLFLLRRFWAAIWASLPPAGPPPQSGSASRSEDTLHPATLVAGAKRVTPLQALGARAYPHLWSWHRVSMSAAPRDRDLPGKAGRRWRSNCDPATPHHARHGRPGPSPRCSRQPRGPHSHQQPVCGAPRRHLGPGTLGAYIPIASATASLDRRGVIGTGTRLAFIQFQFLTSHC